jgi:hypothetical protein
MDSAKDNYIKIICEGQRDQIYLYQRMALIGKSSFLIKEEIFINFKILVKSL